MTEIELQTRILAAGGYAAVAMRLKPGENGQYLSRQAVWGWVHDGNKVPATRAVELAGLLGCKPGDIRPDVFYGKG